MASSKLHLSRSDGATLHLSLLEQKFPQYNVIFQGDFNLDYTISLSDIKAALKTLRPFTSELRMITLVADPSTDELKITTRESSELGSGESTIPLLSKNFTVPFTNSLSINYLTSVLDAVKTPNVLVKSRPLGDLSESPYVITQIIDDEQDSLFRSIIAPMCLA